MLKNPTSPNRTKMTIGKRGQLTYEYLVIIGMIIFLVIPFFDYSFLSLGENILIVEGVAQTVQLATSLEEVGYLSSGSVKNVDVKDVKAIEVSLDGYVTATLVNDKEISIPFNGYVSEEADLTPGRIAVANVDGDVIAMNPPEIGEFQPFNIISAEQATLIGKNFDSEHAVIVLEGEQSSPPQHIRIEYVPDDNPANSNTKLHFSLASKPGQGAYTATVIQKGVASNPKEVVVEPP